MQILVNGVDYTTGRTLCDPLDESTLSDAIQSGLHRNADELRNLTRVSAAGTTFRGEMERQRTPDLGDPRVAGWTFLVPADDPQQEAVIAALRPLAEHRGMVDPAAPLIYDSEPPEEWFDWLLDNFSSLILGQVPHYVLIVGGPEKVPFRFQSLLASAAAVGRVEFDTLDELEGYVAKVLKLERAAGPAVTAEAVCFAPDGGVDDATYFSRRYMAEPLREDIRRKHEFTTHGLFGKSAKKTNLLEIVSGATPALLYTASHGLGALDQPLNVQRSLNGAICCQRTDGESTDDWLLSADDVPRDQAFLEGGVVFQFACFGYGTPAESDYAHWVGGETLNAPRDFVAALPKRLLAHPRGPIAYIGHVDTAWLHGFADPEHPHLLDRWHPRVEPFVRAVDSLLSLQPVGLALATMSKKYDICNALLTGTYDRLQRGRVQISPDFQARLVDAFITRSDAQNYLVFGDPAVRLRIARE